MQQGKTEKRQPDFGQSSHGLLIVPVSGFSLHGHCTDRAEQGENLRKPLLTPEHN